MAASDGHDLASLIGAETQPTDGLLTRLRALLDKVHTLDLGEEEWVSIVSARNYALLHTVTTGLTRARPFRTSKQRPLLLELNQVQIELLYLWVTLDPHRFCGVLLRGHPSVLLQIAYVSEVANDEPNALLPRVLLLQSLLLHSTLEEKRRKMNLHQGDVAKIIKQHIPLLASRNINLYDVTCRNLVLLNHVVSAAQLLLNEAAAAPEGGWAVEFSQRVAHLFNRPFGDNVELSDVDPHERSTILDALIVFLMGVFAHERQTFFYTNDVRVIIDVLLRRANDADKHQAELPSVLELLARVITREAWKERPYKRDEIVKMTAEMVETFGTGSTLEVLQRLDVLFDALGVDEPPPEEDEEEDGGASVGEQKRAQEDEERSASAHAPPPRPPRIPVRRATAVADYAGGVRDDGELLIKQGDEITVMKHDQDGWSYGYSADVESAGWFPASYVQLT